MRCKAALSRWGLRRGGQFQRSDRYDSDSERSSGALGKCNDLPGVTTRWMPGQDLSTTGCSANVVGDNAKASG